jgi:RHS repeat-associated protein
MTTDETGRTFTYDAWNRLIKVNGTTRYAYDALGRRIKEGSTELYYSKDWQVLEERNSSNAPVARYIWSPVYVDAMVLRDRDTNGDGSLDERLFAIYDANYNVTALVQINFSASVVERYLYDPYGRFDVKDASWGNRASSSYAWVYLHQGGRWDATEAMYSFRARDYSPTLMRWGSVDPIGFAAGDVNWYRAEANDPTVCLDPTGELPILIPILVVGGALLFLPGHEPAARPACDFYAAGDAVGGNRPVDESARSCGCQHTDISSESRGVLRIGFGGGLERGGQRRPFRPSTDTRLSVAWDGTIGYGPAAGKPCSKASCDDIAKCIQAKPGRRPEEHSIPFRNCQHDVQQTCAACCLRGYDPVYTVGGNILDRLPAVPRPRDNGRWTPRAGPSLK